MFKGPMIAVFCVLATSAIGDMRTVYLQDGDGEKLAIATLEFAENGRYSIAMDPAHFTDHFLSMRPFRCLEGPAKTWCHVPYPYEIQRDVLDGLTDLEYDLLFVWKSANDYGINMWNGVYYRLTEEDGRLSGKLLEMDMGLLAVPPPTGELRPLQESDLHESDPDSHWLPYLVIE